MVHLVFIHGINNEKKYPSDIERIWWEKLVEGWKKHDFGPIPKKPKITVGYYAQRLYAACKGAPYLTSDPKGELPIFDIDAVVSMGKSDFEKNGNGMELLHDIAKMYEVEIPKKDIQEQGFIRRNLVKLGSLLEDILPEKISKNLARGFLGQAAVYCDKKGLRNGIQRQVMGQISGETDPIEVINKLSDEPLIIVTHSMGTVVGYRMMFSSAAKVSKIPLFITLGSPLSLKFIKKSLDQRELRYPKPFVDRWINVSDDEDGVPMGNSLSKKEIGFEGVENYPTKEYKDDENPHSVGAHLRTYQISKSIYDALS